MECLNGYIGLRWCKSETPESELYINDLQGINLKSIDSIADSEQGTFIEVWEQVQKRGIKRFETAVLNALSRRYKIKTLFESYNFGKSIETVANQTPSANEYRGFTIELNDYSSPLQVISIQSLSLYLKVGGSVTVKIFEVLTEDSAELFTKTFTGVEGWNKIPINKDFLEVRKLFIAYNSSSINSPYKEVDGGCGCVFEGCGALVNGAKSDLSITDIETGNNTFGLSGVFSVKCLFSQLLCDNKSLFATALWYALGAELMSERIYSDRLNRYTTIDLAKAKELRTEFAQIADNELQNALEGIQLNLSDCCIDCGTLVTTAYMKL